MKKDFYAILGVLPSAEDIVIRAAYKALAQRYHPDRFGLNGNKEEANIRMTEINDAYAVLSDMHQRKEYDQACGAGTQSSSSFFDSNYEAPPSSTDPLEKNWQVALEYYPDLQSIENRLAKIAWRLAYSYRAYLLEIKDFNKRHQLADTIEEKFLKTYFGTNSQIVDFAKILILAGNKKAALALNEAIRILGDKADASNIIIKIRRDYAPHDTEKTELGRLLEKIQAIPNELGVQRKAELITLLGGQFKWLGMFSNRCAVMLNNKESVFDNEKEFSKWVDAHVIPMLKDEAIYRKRA